MGKDQRVFGHRKGMMMGVETCVCDTVYDGYCICIITSYHHHIIKYIFLQRWPKGNKSFLRYYVLLKFF